METSMKSKSFCLDSDDMVSKKDLPPRETEDTHFLQDFLSLKFNPKVDPKSASLDGFADNGSLETPTPEVVGFGNLGINLRGDVSDQLLSLPTDKETTLFNPKADWKKAQKLSKKPKDKFQRGSVMYGTEKVLQELLECRVQLTNGTHGVIQSEDMDPVGGQYKKDCHYLQFQCLGAGSFGRAYFCKDTDSGKEFVKKEIKKDLLKDSEVVVPLMLKHENITKVLGLIQEEDEEGCITMSLLMEYGGISLNVFMASHCDLQECHFFQLAKHGLRGLEHMHKFGMNHFDIKPENLLVMNANNGLLMKLTDFGTSKLAQERISLSGWTPEYMAPECAQFVLQMQLANQGGTCDVTGKADVFPMAMVIMYMYCKAHVLVKLITQGKTTYNHMGVEERKNKQTELLFKLANDQTFVQDLIPDDCCREMRSLLKLMTEHDPKGRCSAQEARRFIEEYQQKKDQRLCFKSVQATDHALKLKAKQQADSVKQKLRNKLRPYTKPSLSPALAVSMTPVEELNKLSLHQAKEPEHGDRVVQSGMEYPAVVCQPVRHIIPQTVEILDVSDHQQNEMQPAIPMPSLFVGEVDFNVYDSGEGLFKSNHQSLRQVTDDSSRSRAFDENEVTGNVPNFSLL